MFSVKISQADSSYQLLTCEKKRKRTMCDSPPIGKKWRPRQVLFFIIQTKKEEERNNVITFLFTIVEYGTYAWKLIILSGFFFLLLWTELLIVVLSLIIKNRSIQINSIKRKQINKRVQFDQIFNVLWQVNVLKALCDIHTLTRWKDDDDSYYTSQTFDQRIMSLIEDFYFLSVIWTIERTSSICWHNSSNNTLDHIFIT